MKVIFLPKNDFSFLLFVHSYLSYVTLFFIFKLFRLDLRNFIQVWWATLRSDVLLSWFLIYLLVIFPMTNWSALSLHGILLYSMQYVCYLCLHRWTKEKQISRILFSWNCVIERVFPMILCSIFVRYFAIGSTYNFQNWLLSCHS